MDYNIAALTNSSALTTVLQAINNESVGGVVKPIDVLILQETDSSAGEAQQIANILNGFGTGTYAPSTVDGATTGGGRPTLVYRTETIQTLISQVSVVGTSGSGAARSPMRYQLRPVGYDCDDDDPDFIADDGDIYIYNSHYKSSDNSTDAARRNVEAQAIRANSDALGQGAHVIYAGDFNIYRSTEPMWATLTGAGNGQAFDPVNRVGVWHDGASFIDVHSQNPAGAGFVGGGMDDRFDWQMVTSEVQDNEGMSYISGSYHVFGNNGTHSMNGHINSGSGASPTVLTALGNASDHLPLVAQYQLPAKMATSVASIPSQVIVGAAVNAQVSVSNSAGDGVLVVSSTGADELDYRIVGSGAASGTVYGTDAAFGTGNDHPFALDTAAAGSKSASFAIDAITSSAPLVLTNPQVPNGNQMQEVEYNVLDHANASFSNSMNDDSLTIDFGAITVGSGNQQSAFSISNLVATAGFTAPLDSVSFLGTGDTGVLSTDLAPIDDLAAGSIAGFMGIFDTSAEGNYSATYTLTFSDDTALLGAVGGQQLTLNLLGQVTSVAGLLGDLDDDEDVDAGDIDILWSIVRQTGTDPNNNDTGDLNSDTLVNEDDVDTMLASLLTAGANRAYGDANLSGGTPELTDYDMWRTGTGGWAGGDFDGSGGAPELNDYNLWRTGPTQFPDTVGSHGGGGGGPLGELVPEPSSICLLAMALPWLRFLRKRRNSVVHSPVD